MIELGHREITQKFEWMSYNNHKTLIRLWKKIALHQNTFSNFNELQQSHPDKLNALMGYLNDTDIQKFVDSPGARYEVVIQYCSANNNLIDWQRSKHDFLPNISHSNEYLALQHNTLDTDLRQRSLEISKFASAYCTEDYTKDLKGGRTREALAEEVGNEVARRNFYKKEEELSKAEANLRKSLRSIYSIEKNGQKMYLSIDFEKCIAFEWCNNNGEHLGEFRFDGQQNGQKDKSGGHDILALKK